MPRELVKIDIDKLKKYVKEKLNSFSEIAGVYLFGSSLEKMRPDSDIDLGIIKRPGVIKTERELEIFLEKIILSLNRFEGHSFDIVSVQDVNTILAFEILKKGMPIYIKDKETVTDLIESVSRKYSEDYPRYKQALELIVGAKLP
ncbi:MAG: uncharacterized protein PWQ82_1281 [Thermosediminibacterales bacterium]|nr:uncharacterized protein [Thermosediminibacterales bacterium]MDK2836612.1 uncharacterized protein [Thermosediminibacterales bacterium]